MATIGPRVTTHLTIILAKPQQPTLPPRPPVTQNLTGVTCSDQTPATPISSENSTAPRKSILRTPGQKDDIKKELHWDEENLKQLQQARISKLRMRLQNAVNQVQNTGNARPQWTPNDANKVAPIISIQSPTEEANPLLRRISAIREQLQKGISNIETPLYRNHIQSQIHTATQHMRVSEAVRQYQARVHTNTVVETIAAHPQQLDRSQLTALTREIAQRSAAQIQQHSKEHTAQIEAKITRQYLATPPELRSHTQIRNGVQAEIQALEVKLQPRVSSAELDSGKTATKKPPTYLSRYVKRMKAATDQAGLRTPEPPRVVNQRNPERA